MKRRMFSLAALLLLVLSISVQAAQPRAVSADPILYFSGTTANCSANCNTGNTSDKVSATLTLYQGGTYVDSWSGSGTGSAFISGSCKVQSGKSYTLILSYSINGQSKPSVYATGTCP